MAQHLRRTKEGDSSKRSVTSTTFIITAVACAAVICFGFYSSRGAKLYEGSTRRNLQMAAEQWFSQPASAFKVSLESRTRPFSTASCQVSKFSMPSGDVLQIENFLPPGVPRAPFSVCCCLFQKVTPISAEFFWQTSPRPGIASSSPIGPRRSDPRPRIPLFSIPPTMPSET